MKSIHAALALCSALLPLASAQAACPTDLEAAAMAAAIVARQTVPQPAGELSMADGQCGRDKVVRYLAQAYGETVGYKAGLTNPAVQKRFKYDAPLRGTLFKSMLAIDGAELPAAFGARPVFEADLLVEVANPAALADAQTPLAALRALRSYAPFIELPDLMVEAPPKLNGTALSAINVGARLGVVGQPMAVPRDAAARQRLLDGLQGMTVRVSDASGVLSSGKGSDTLGHPLNAVVWLTGALRQQGLQLQPGQVVSLGSFSPLSPPKAGQKVTVQYEGLPGAKPVTVNFR